MNPIYFVVVLSILMASPFSHAGESGQSKVSKPGRKVKCLSYGEQGQVMGVPSGEKGWVLKPPCCEGLQDIESLKVCGKGNGGGYAYVCTKCGDSKCDKSTESRCNCPIDCGGVTPKAKLPIPRSN